MGTLLGVLGVFVGLFVAALEIDVLGLRIAACGVTVTLAGAALGALYYHGKDEA